MLFTAHDVVLAQAAVHFAASTRYCDQAKLMSLLYLFDVGHYRQTGRSATNAVYMAQLKGPFNPVLAVQLRSPSGPLASFVQPDPAAPSGVAAPILLPQRHFSHIDLTPRHMELLSTLSAQYADHTAAEISQEVFAKSSAWRTLLANGADTPIDYAIAVRERFKYAALVHGATLPAAAAAGH